MKGHGCGGSSWTRKRMYGDPTHASVVVGKMLVSSVHSSLVVGPLAAPSTTIGNESSMRLAFRTAAGTASFPSSNSNFDVSSRRFLVEPSAMLTSSEVGESPRRSMTAEECGCFFSGDGQILLRGAGEDVGFRGDEET